MFDSGIKAKDLIADLKNEIDVALPIPDSYYVIWLNETEQLLYSEVIREQQISEPENGDKRILIKDLPLHDSAEEDSIRAGDIYTIYADGVQLTKVNRAVAHLFKNIYYYDGKYLEIVTQADSVGTIRLIYFVRPIPKKIANGLISEDTIKLPPEFISLISAKIRGEAYKLANEDAIAAKWLNDYNALLENFKMWISNREPNFGM